MTTAATRQIRAARHIVGHIAGHLKADLSLRLWNGEVLPLGPGARDDIQLVIARPGVVRRILLAPRLMTLFELFAAGELRIEGGSPLEAAQRWEHGDAVHLRRRVDAWLVARSAWPFLFGADDRSVAELPAWDAPDGVGQARRKRRDKDFIQFHYDVGNEFYALFLDPEMVYSSAYFPGPDATLEEAQREKLDRICRKLRLKPGQRMLDCGCGWAGLACWAAQYYGVSVHGVTLSQAQLDYGRAKVKRLGLEHLVTLELKDYREVDEPGGFDVIAQVEMFEHAGFANHDRHFEQMHRLLKPGGLYFHQASVRRGGRARTVKPTRTTRVITRFIFPGGELDTIGMTVTNMGRLGFEVLDVEDMREHFQLTLHEWARRLYAQRATAVSLVGEARTRLWLIYFALFAKGFERGAVLVYQTVAQHRRPGRSGLPLDRASLYR